MALPLPGPIALRAVQEAEDNVGVRETPNKNNFGPFIRIYLAAVNLLQGNPWCLAFIVFRLLNAAADLGLKVPASMPQTGYTPTFASWGKSNGRWISVQEARANPALVQRGDLAFFYKSSLGRIGHVGVVTSVRSDRGGVLTVEGNTGPDGGRDGDGVYRKNRDWSELGAKGGFVRLPF